MGEPTSNGKAEIYQREVVGAMEACFPLITVKRKSTDPPWINGAIRRKLQKRRGVYRREGRASKWKRLKKATERMIEKRKEKYVLSQKDALLAKDGDRNFFKNVKNYQSHERPVPFDVTTLFPGKSEGEVAKILSQHFNTISAEFDPLEPSEIPVTKNRRLPLLAPYQVAGRLRAFKKPKSMVQGDIFPALVTRYGLSLIHI